MKNFVYGVHIMWYEVGMIEEHLASLSAAIYNATWPIEVVIAVNYQTYIEKPTMSMERVRDKLEGALYDGTKELPSFVDLTIFHVDDNLPFYNIADFRRELKCDEGYVIWGEVDALLPESYFACLEAADAIAKSTPCVFSFASRKMWDDSWFPVEHFYLQDTTLENTAHPFKNTDYITQAELDAFNEQFTPTCIQLLNRKIDGSLLAVRYNVPQLIPDDMHFAREDFIAQEMLTKYGIPQMHFSTVLKGHNYKHPNKRWYTDSNREEDIYKKYEWESLMAGVKFVEEYSPDA